MLILINNNKNQWLNLYFPYTSLLKLHINLICCCIALFLELIDFSYNVSNLCLNLFTNIKSVYNWDWVIPTYFQAPILPNKFHICFGFQETRARNDLYTKSGLWVNTSLFTPQPTLCTSCHTGKSLYSLHFSRKGKHKWGGCCEKRNKYW